MSSAGAVAEAEVTAGVGFAVAAGELVAVALGVGATRLAEAGVEAVAEAAAEVGAGVAAAEDAAAGLVAEVAAEVAPPPCSAAVVETPDD